ncbi:hypothetical protein [Novosphingobium guangzhouense]|uniref:Uncharacterized protein n=1 Tax=Novosphingobium guangzhouense TaxID=1850347 RepID=A0A2K2G4B0_9SPHN|nr:hypothetical protein [Novosphingobium guangzhouense]PNU05828.1 hypothetical protein A8V01_14785 [Novosphingobium guangzhouense]
MSRRVTAWIDRIDCKRPHEMIQCHLLQSAAGGIGGAIGGLALGLMLIRPLLHFCGLEGAWR